jgi:hypothetical protein
MRIFTVDAVNTVAVSTSVEHRSLTNGAARFTNERQLAALAVKWPSGRLLEISNNLPRVRKVTKFRDRQTGVHRIWVAIQHLKAHGGEHAITKGSNCSSRSKETTPVQEPAIARLDTKAGRVIALLKHPAGATLRAIMALTGWQAHSVRGFITAHVRQKMNYRVQSFTRGGERVYRILPGPGSSNTGQSPAERSKT